MYGCHLEKLPVNHFWALRSRLLLLELKTRKRSVCFSWPHNCAFFSKTAQRWAWKRREHSKLVKDDNSYEFNFRFVVLIWSDVSWQREQDPCTILKKYIKIVFFCFVLKVCGRHFSVVFVLTYKSLHITEYGFQLLARRCHLRIIFILPRFQLICWNHSASFSYKTCVYLASSL